MITGVYIWFDYMKPTGSNASHIDWVGTIDIEKAKRIIDMIKPEDMLKKQPSNYFSHNVELSISMQEIKSGKVLYKRKL